METEARTEKLNQEREAQGVLADARISAQTERIEALTVDGETKDARISALECTEQAQKERIDALTVRFAHPPPLLHRSEGRTISLPVHLTVGGAMS